VRNKLGRNARQYTEMRRSLMMDIRVGSPDGKSKKQTKPKAKKKTVGETGVAAARDVHSTYVSSPVHGASKRRHGRVFDDDEDDTPVSLHNNGYYRDSFVVDDDDDGFEPVRFAGTEKVSKQRELGPPIIRDGIMDSLTPRHRMIVTNFVIHAKNKGKSLMLANNLRGQPFTDTMLRAMMVGFVTTERDMLRIPGVRPEMVELYGRHFLEMTKASRDLYRSMKAKNEDDDERPHDPNHRNVIDLVSDDESDYGDDVDLEDDEEEEVDEEDDEDEEVHSGYFQQPTKSAEVLAFNQKMQMADKSGPAKPAKASKKAFAGKPSYRKGPRKSKAKRKSNGTRPARGGAPMRGGNSGGGGRNVFGGGGIGMMPV
jgi:bloom syndrome protein